MGIENISCINVPDRMRNTPLHYVAKFDCSQLLIQKLLSTPLICMTQENREGCTPLQVSIDYDSVTVFNELRGHVKEEKDRDG